MATAQNILHSTIFNFEYKTKASARRGNELIESIFSSHIVPELEKAISSKIPKEARIELSKLEINIGTINENELTENLAKRIRKSLEDALTFNFDYNKTLNVEGIDFEGKTPDNYLIESIEIFLVKGYFPFGIEKSLTVDELVQRIINKNIDGLTEVLLRHHNQEQVIQRVALNLNTETFDKILTAQDPVNSSWIIEFRKIMMNLKKELNLNQYSDSEFIKMMNSYILRYTLNETSLTFSKEKFSTNIINWVIDVFEPDMGLFAQVINKHKGNSSASLLINKSLAQLQKERNRYNDEDENQPRNNKQQTEISNYHKLLSEIEDQTRQNSRVLIPKPEENEKFAMNHSSNIISYFLKNGHLPEPFSHLDQEDLQLIFLELIIQKDDFLALEISKSANPESLTTRLNMLIQASAPDDLEAYFIHYFHEDYIVLTQIIADLTQHFDYGYNGHEIKKPIVNRIFIAALTKSRAENSPSLFRFVALELLLTELTNNNPSPERIHQLFISYSLENRKPETISETEGLFSHHSKILIKKALEEQLGLFLKKVHFTENWFISPGKEVKEVVNKIVFYAQIDPSVFLITIQEFRNELQLIYTFFKFFLPPLQWKYIEKFLLSKVELKNEIGKFQNHSDIVLKNIFRSTLNLKEKFELLKKSDPEIFKDFLRLIINDNKLFDKFIAETGEMQILSELTFQNKTFQTFLRQLISVPSETFSGRISVNFWKSVVLTFGIRIFTDENKISTETFSNAFMGHLLRKLKTVNEVDLYYPLIGKMKDSNSKVLNELVKIWQTSTRVELAEKEENKIGENKNIEADPEKKNSLKELEHHFLILGFYAQTGFFPWWAGQIIFPEIIDKLHVQAVKNKRVFEEIFLRAEKESRIFENLVKRIPHSAHFEICNLISKSEALKAKWEEVLNHKKGSETKEETPGHQGKFKSDNEQNVKHWLKQNPEIAGQIRAYLKLAPFFYYKNTTPAQWREVVFEFAQNYYKEDFSKEETKFHIEFLKFIKTRYFHTNWNEVLKSVYYAVQQPEIKDKVVFPAALTQLLELQTEFPKHIKELNKKMDILFLDENTGIGVNVYNAGLVIFWPFLTRLFENLSFVRKGRFINSYSMNRAIYILQYLIYNKTDFPEYELVLNKILTGMNTEEHLAPPVILTEDEKNMSASLLNGLINNWEKVKSSTPEGIQETFLQRDGILKFKKDEFFLEVEKKGVDILVKSIPWNLSPIKLSWMEKPLHVEWV